jgi:hypothetical protein
MKYTSIIFWTDNYPLLGWRSPDLAKNIEKLITRLKGNSFMVSYFTKSHGDILTALQK